MSGEELLNFITEKVHVIETTNSMQDLNSSIEEIIERLDRFTGFHRRKIYFGEEIPEVRKCGHCNVMPVVERRSNNIIYECPICHSKASSSNNSSERSAVANWNDMVTRQLF